MWQGVGVNVTIHREPRPYMVVEDFVSREAQDTFLRGLNQNDFERGTFREPSSTLDEASTGVVNENTEIKNNYLMKLGADDAFVNYFLERFYSDEMSSAFDRMNDQLFELLHYLNEGHFQISRYGEGGVYQNHRDYGLLAANLYLALEDKVLFKGGELFFEGIRIPFKPRTLVLFPAISRHRVGRVTSVPTDKLYHRYSLQYWPTFCNRH